MQPTSQSHPPLLLPSSNEVNHYTQCSGTSNTLPQHYMQCTVVDQQRVLGIPGHIHNSYLVHYHSIIQSAPWYTKNTYLVYQHTYTTVSPEGWLTVTWSTWSTLPQHHTECTVVDQQQLLGIPLQIHNNVPTRWTYSVLSYLQGITTQLYTVHRGTPTTVIWYTSRTRT